MSGRGDVRRWSITRALYAFVVLTAPACAAYVLVSTWIDYFTSSPLPWYRPQPPWFLSLVTLAGFIVPGAMAGWRVTHRLPLMPDARLRARPVVAGVVALASGFSIAIALLLTSVVADVIARAADDVGGPLLFFGMLMAMAASIALLAAELALIGSTADLKDPKPHCTVPT